MTMPLGKAVLLLGAAAMLSPFAVSAQDVRDLDAARSDVLIFDGAVTTTPARFRYTMQAGTALQVDVVPKDGSELDPVLTITDAATNEVLAEDDDSGGNLASRARLTTDRRRVVEISVSAFEFFSGEESVGPFELQLRPSAWVPERTRSIGYGAESSGRLGEGGQDLFTITGEAGQLLEVALLAGDEDLDPLLNLYQGSGTEGELLASDDDGGEALNSLLRIVLPETGTYTIGAAAYGSSQGSYRLRVGEQRTHALQAPEQVLGLGERVSGYLGSGYEEGSLDPAQITYRLTPEAIAAIRAGADEVTFNMTVPLVEDSDFPSSIDAVLELGLDTPLGFASIMSNDDGGEDLNSRIAVDLGPLATNGDLLERLRLRAGSIGGTGAFEIELVEGLQEVRAPAVYDEYLGEDYRGEDMPQIEAVPAD